MGRPASRALEILKSELDVAMALCGVNSIAEINRDVLADRDGNRQGV